MLVASKGNTCPNYVWIPGCEKRSSLIPCYLLGRNAKLVFPSTPLAQRCVKAKKKKAKRTPPKKADPPPATHQMDVEEEELTVDGVPFKVEHEGAWHYIIL